jgi:hypothetical protein
MAVTGIYLLHKSWCNLQKNDHMIATLVPKLHVDRVGLGAAAWVQLDRSNREDSKTGQVGIP